MADTEKNVPALCRSEDRVLKDHLAGRLIGWEADGSSCCYVSCSCIYHRNPGLRDSVWR